MKWNLFALLMVSWFSLAPSVCRDRDGTRVVAPEFSDPLNSMGILPEHEEMATALFQK